MTPLKPGTKQNLITALRIIETMIMDFPVEKSCTTCTYYKDKACKMFDSVPPEHIVKVGCDSWEWDTFPFP